MRIPKNSEFQNRDIKQNEQTKACSAFVDEYEGVHQSQANWGRTFLETDTNISVRSEYNRADYEYYRQYESSPKQIKNIMRVCNNAYEKVPLVRSVIDMMADFTVQGIRIYHPNRSVQNFMNKWAKISGFERTSERIANTLYRLGNCPIKTKYGKVPVATEKEWKKVTAKDDVKLQKPKVEKRRIPLGYNILNPWSLDVVGEDMMGFIEPMYVLNISSTLATRLHMLEGQAKKNNRLQEAINQIPADVAKVIKSGGHILMDPEKFTVLFYKKDDWQVWAVPMLASILNQLSMLEKMHLADISALDGAISQIRLWQLGSLEYNIMPTRAGITKLRNILASTGTGVLDLVWGPDLDFKESNSQVHNYLSGEKYSQVMSEIYAGLGVPPSLTGSGASGAHEGFTNNFVSIKTLIERLEYVRDILVEFWEQQFVLIQKAMGFAKPARIIFDYKVLANEATEQDILRDMWDRHIISTESLREALGKDNVIEETRIAKEEDRRSKGKMSDKASPFHNPQTEHELKRIILQSGGVAPSEVGVELDEMKEGDKTIQDRLPKPEPSSNFDPKKKNGRPPNSRDQSPRKQKTQRPRTSAAFVETFMWANKAQAEISDIINPLVLKEYKKKNLRQLSKEQARLAEDTKFAVLSKIEPNSNITKDLVYNILQNEPILDGMTEANVKILASIFRENNQREPNLDELKQIQSSAYALERTEDV